MAKNLIFTLFLLLSIAAAGQNRPRVGLALSGGAARGLAHIGVLKVLEEVGLQPDYITGTSMGSIVGGLYAMGYSADSLERIARSLDWSKVLSDQISLRQVFFEEKPYFRNELLELPIREGRVSGPGGLVQGQQIQEVLSRLTMPALAVDQFDSLPVPFRCMAADIVSGRPVMLEQGSLARAIRASMAIPSLFTPVYRDSMVLVDGGLIRNFPVQELDSLGADILIGVYVGAKPSKVDELRSITQLMYQIAFLPSIEDYDRQLPLLDIYIEPDLTGYSAMDFVSADSIITRGERAARRQYDRLKALADSLNAIGPPYPHPPLPPVESVAINRIEVTGNRQFEDNEIIGQSGLWKKTPVKADDLKEAVESLFGTNRYEKVTYDLRRSGSSNILNLETQEKAPYLLKVAFTYDTYHKAGLNFNFFFRNLLLDASRFMFVGRLSNNHRYRAEYLKYIDRTQRWFFQAELQYNRDVAPILQNGRAVEEYRLVDVPLDLTFNRRLGRNSLLSAGAQFEWLSLRPVVSGTPVFSRLRYQNANIVLGLQTNTLDRNVLPTRGTRVSIELKYATNLDYSITGLLPEIDNPDSLFLFSPYPKFSFRSESFFPTGEKSSLLLSAFAGLLGTGDIPITDVYLIGAPDLLSRRSIPFYGFGAGEFLAQTAAGFQLGFQHFLRSNLLWAFHLNGGLFAEPLLGQKGLRRPDIFLAGTGLSLAYNSLLGPIRLTVMHPLANNGDLKQRLKAFLSFGYRF